MAVFSLPALSQVRTISGVKIKGTNESTRLYLENEDKTVKDYALYRDIIRKYTWYVGVGDEITQQTANHLPYYYKLSMKNNHGHWQRIQAMHQDTMTSRHDKNTYVLDKRKDTDTENSEWIKKIRQITQWYITSDLSGDEVVEERAYTADGDLVYSYMPIKNSDGRITGSYNDAWGLPADMREDENTTYGSVVCITLDCLGRDSIIDFLDGQGYRKYNSNGVDQERYIYDEKDRVVQLTSHNMVGDYTNDNWGNCGNLYIYDDDLNKYSIYRLDKNLEPMRMPSFRAGPERTFIRCDIKRDKWGREIEERMLDVRGAPDATSSGIYKITHEYDDKGNLLSTNYYDLNGNPIDPKTL